MTPARAAALLVLAMPAATYAQPAKPRFVLLLDTSSSMLATPNASETPTHGDGSQLHPGCDVDGNGAYDDSRIFQAKAAVADTIAAFGSAEFALGRYASTLMGQTCTVDADCTAVAASTACIDPANVPGTARYCTRSLGSSTSGLNYDECPASATCVNCANPSDTVNHIYEKSVGCNSSNPCIYPNCKGGRVVVGFPTSGSNYREIYRWIDGIEDDPPFTANSNREIRADSSTPLASSTDSMREWLTTPGSSVGPDAGILASDPQLSCRSYNVIVITDGEETCTGDPVAAARNTYHRCTNGGLWDNGDQRCEISGNPAGTTESLPRVKVYVVGFATDASSTAQLHAMAAAGGTGQAIFASNRAELTAKLGDIISGSIPAPRCDCDETCDGPETQSFPQKGQACSVGVGRCKRSGVYGCNAAGDGTVCASTAANVCPATPLAPGAPTTEVCGIAPGCLAPTAQDCADDDCDGQIDENLSCACAAKPELCNGMDDNCNNMTDEGIMSVPCGLSIGECRPGTTACVSAQTVCQGAVGPTPEICDNKDNDCDGVIDGIAQTCFPTGFTGCSYNAGTMAWTCQGTCQAGRQVCTAGMWGACAGAITPVLEVPCDGLDNDCDGLVDEPEPGMPTTCYPANTPGCNVMTGMCVGECKLGTPSCQPLPGGGGSVQVCQGAITPRAELCDGKDNDCNGMADDGFDVGAECDNGVVGPCRKVGKKLCNAIGTGTVCSVPPPGEAEEVCDGEDNDCDGMIDEGPLPGVGVPCGSAVGECRRGISMCVAGKIVCNDMGPMPEICDGKDNDCDGSVDEDLMPPAAECPPPGLPAGAPIVGECKPGRFICMPDETGKWGWQCRGFVGPMPEICDGKDNDCDGKADQMAICPMGSACHEGECAPRCQKDEFPCPTNRMCVNDICIVKECVLKPCADGQICGGDGQCRNPCDGVVCAPGAMCVGGICQDCYSRGCPAGQLCRARVCEADPCAGVTCGALEYCRDGRCVKDCATVSCGAGELCRDGACVADACAHVICNDGQFCDPTDGQCKAKSCLAIQCMPGYACVDVTGKCELDPCDVTRCLEGTECVILPDGQAHCASEVPRPPPVVRRISTTGGGMTACDCHLGGSSAPTSGGWLVFGLALAGLVRVRRRRGSR